MFGFGKKDIYENLDRSERLLCQDIIKISGDNMYFISFLNEEKIEDMDRMHYCKTNDKSVRSYLFGGEIINRECNFKINVVVSIEDVNARPAVHSDVLHVNFMMNRNNYFNVRHDEDLLLNIGMKSNSVNQLPDLQKAKLLMALSGELCMSCQPQKYGYSYQSEGKHCVSSINEKIFNVIKNDKTLNRPEHMSR